MRRGSLSFMQPPLECSPIFDSVTMIINHALAHEPRLVPCLHVIGRLFEDDVLLVERRWRQARLLTIDRERPSEIGVLARAISCRITARVARVKTLPLLPRMPLYSRA